MNIDSIIQDLTVERDRLTRAIVALKGAEEPPEWVQPRAAKIPPVESFASVRKHKDKRSNAWTPERRKKHAAALKAAWAKRRKAKK